MKFGRLAEKLGGIMSQTDNKYRSRRGKTAIWQAKLMLLIMINLAQLWILAATVEAALGREYKQLIPLVIASGVCWLISLTLIFWWKPATEQNKPIKK